MESDMLNVFKCVELIVKHFFLADLLFLGGHLRYGKIHFSMVDVFFLGDHHLWLESSCIQVNTVMYNSGGHVCLCACLNCYHSSVMFGIIWKVQG
jgi:hypothetical protein